jgi:general secretion pathway protein G
MIARPRRGSSGGSVVTTAPRGARAPAGEGGYTIAGALLASLAVAVMTLLGAEYHAQSAHYREQEAARALVSRYEQAVLDWQAGHPQAPCPRSLADLAAAGLVEGAPIDPWGEPLVYRCPGEASGEGADVASKGADRVAGTLDDINGWE